MNVLMVEDLTPVAAATSRALRDAGIHVRCCRDDPDNFACHALLGGKCPLDAAPIDAAVAVREGGSGITTYGANRHEAPSLGDEGIVCALRRHIPLVMVCDTGDPYGGPFDEWIEAACVHGEVADVVEDVVSSPLEAYSQVATKETRATLEAFGAHVSEAHAQVTRRDGCLKVTITLPAGIDQAMFESCAVKVLGALHAFDPSTSKVDVSRG